MGNPNPSPESDSSFWDNTIKTFAVLILIVAFLFACGVLNIQVPYPIP